jgi:uncharacterized protein with PIN domain
MDGMFWSFLATAVALLLLAFAFMSRRQSEVGPKARRCSNCRTPISMRRVSITIAFPHSGWWKCAHCGSQIKSRRGMTQTME